MLQSVSIFGSLLYKLEGPNRGIARIQIKTSMIESKTAAEKLHLKHMTIFLRETPLILFLSYSLFLSYL